MLSTGVVRRADQLGRFSIPKEIRNTLGINIKDGLEIFVKENLIILRKFNSKGACIITGEILDENFEYAPGIILSPKGASILLEEIQEQID